MLNLGMGELLLIVLVALLVFGPDRLPEIMRNLGKAFKTFQDETRKAADTLRVNFDEAPSGQQPTAAAQPTAIGPGVIDTPDGTPPVPVAEAPAAAPMPTTPADVSPAVRRYEDT